MIRIERVELTNLHDVLPMIEQYQAFYRVEANPARNRDFFGRLARDELGGAQFLARSAEDKPLGFATLYFPYSSLKACRSCLLNDLFTIPESRGQGVGKTLVRYCGDFARASGFSALEWFTHKDNLEGQALYRQFPASVTEWLNYEWTF